MWNVETGGFSCLCRKEEWTQNRIEGFTCSPESSNSICAFTPSQDSAGPSHLLKRPHCILATAAALLPLLTTILSNHSSQPHTQSLTCSGLEVIISLLPKGGKKESRKKRELSGKRLPSCSLTPCSDSRGSALTRTAGIPSSINILLLRLPVKEHRRSVRRVF